MYLGIWVQQQQAAAFLSNNHVKNKKLIELQTTNYKLHF
jgi:hypothetical protein